MAATQKDEELIRIARGLQNVPWCDEYEKMISGMLYNSLVPVLSAGRFKARTWCHRYNNIYPPDSDPSITTLDEMGAHRLGLLREIIGEVGDDVFIEPPFIVDYGCNIRLGRGFYANFGLKIVDGSIVTIGARTMFGPDVSIYAATHETEVQSRRDDIEYAEAVTIGEDCWIAGRVTILSGVTIGDGVTIAAGSLVTRDIPSWTVAMGTPARVVKKVTPLAKPDEAAS